MTTKHSMKKKKFSLYNNGDPNINNPDEPNNDGDSNIINPDDPNNNVSDTFNNSDKSVNNDIMSEIINDANSFLNEMESWNGLKGIQK